MGFELNQQKTEKPASLKIWCSHASQLVTKNPPDRVIMAHEKTFNLVAVETLLPWQPVNCAIN